MTKVILTKTHPYIFSEHQRMGEEIFMALTAFDYLCIYCYYLFYLFIAKSKESQLVKHILNLIDTAYTNKLYKSKSI